MLSIPEGYKPFVDNDKFALLFSIAATYLYTIDQFRLRNQNRKIFFLRNL